MTIESQSPSFNVSNEDQEPAEVPGHVFLESDDLIDLDRLPRDVYVFADEPQYWDVVERYREETGLREREVGIPPFITGVHWTELPGILRRYLPSIQENPPGQN